MPISSETVTSAIDLERKSVQDKAAVQESATILENSPVLESDFAESLFEINPFELPQIEKNQLLLFHLQKLHKHHAINCTEYGNLFPEALTGKSNRVENIEDLPYLAVRLFKYLSLVSVPKEQYFKTLFSSGTTGQTPAKIILDQATSRRQSQVLVKVLQDFIGKQRLPMLIIDHPEVISSRNSYSARGAGIQGVSFFGRKPSFALNADMSINTSVVSEFVENHGDGPVLLFGFTFMVWQYFLVQLEALDLRLSLPLGTLIHSGGWKKLEAQKVSNTAFKETCNRVLGVKKVHNFYGMAEQVGSIFVECEAGHHHAPVFSDVIIRDPLTMSVLPIGKSGLIQVLSVVPGSYPGHTLLTEDLGRILGVDDCSCGRKGKYFEVLGRLPKAEVRGCSDTFS